MRHLDEEQILAAVRAEAGTETATHLAQCRHCRSRLAATEALRDATTAVEAEDHPDTAVPSFDALVLPELRRVGEPVPVAVPDASSSWRITVALVLRQARLVPAALWPLTALGFTVLLFLAWRATPFMGSLLLGPGITLVVTTGALAVCEPRRDPRNELLYSMPVPPVAVWLTRLALVVGVDLITATALTVVVGRLSDTGADVSVLVASWLGPALLTAALAAFGAVWQSPMVGVVLGGCGWLTGVAASAGDVLPAPGAFLRVVETAWSTNVGTLTVALLLTGAAALLLTRPRHALGEGAV